MPCLSMNDVLDQMKGFGALLRYRNVHVKPRMSFAFLSNFERLHKLRFPGEYRMYLLEIANGWQGNIGPCKEGLLAFGETPFGYPHHFASIVDNLKSPFPYNEQVIFDESHKPRQIGGYILLGTCFYSEEWYWLLVCEGQQRGQVWIVNWAVGIFPCQKMSFKDWLKDWLENDGQELRYTYRCLPSFTELASIPVSEDYYFSRQRRGAVELREGLIDVRYT